MKIKLSNSDKNIFTSVNSFEKANQAAKAIFKRNYWSDLYYSIIFDDGCNVAGSIDLEPASFHKSHQNTIVTTHLKTFWGNISKLKEPKYGFTQDDINECKNLLNRI